MIGIIDYGAGNLQSVINAFDFIGAECCLVTKAEQLASCDKAVLPGVGAFGNAVELLTAKGFNRAILSFAAKKPFLGICLGMQLLFEESFEFGRYKGLGLIPGTVELISGEGLIVPHMGWNSLQIKKPCALLKDVAENSFVYFVHSYRAVCSAEYINATTFYGGDVPAIVSKGHVFGTQFHPEKSDAPGLCILKNFVNF